MTIKSVSAWFFLIFLLAGGLVAVFAIFQVNSPQVTLLNGQLTKQYESEFDKKLVHRPWSIDWLNKLNFALFKEGRDGVIIGTDGWLFTSEEFALSDDYQKNIKANEEYIKAVKAILDQENIKLFIVPVPAKARLFSSHLGRYKYLEAWELQYQEFLKFLGQNKVVHNIDLENVLSNEEEFLKTDTHWTPEGARSVALNTAFHIEKNFPYLSWKRENFKSKKSKILEYEGDLTRYTVKSEETVNQWETVATENSDNLFGDKDYAVVLIGTSYSANALWNFDGFLKEALGTDVLNMADEGLGPFQVMQNYLSDDSYKNNKPKLIIWEIPERYLPVKTKEKS